MSKWEVEMHLRKGLTITPLQALKDYHTMRLASIINRLRNEGMNITTTIDKEKHYATYQLEKPCQG